VPPSQGMKMISAVIIAVVLVVVEGAVTNPVAVGPFSTMTESPPTMTPNVGWVPPSDSPPTMTPNVAWVPPSNGPPTMTPNVAWVPPSDSPPTMTPNVAWAPRSNISIQTTCPANWFMSPDGQSCYFVAPTFNSGNFFETAAFCASIGGAIMEPDTMQDLQGVYDIVTNYGDSWTEGVWIGLIRPYNNSQVVILSSLSKPEDQKLLQHLSTQLQPQNVTEDANCAGFNSLGTFSLYDCQLAPGNPFCERYLEYTFADSDDSDL